MAIVWGYLRKSVSPTMFLAGQVNSRLLNFWGHTEARGELPSFGIINLQGFPQLLI